MNGQTTSRRQVERVMAGEQGTVRADRMDQGYGVGGDRLRRRDLLRKAAQLGAAASFGMAAAPARRALAQRRVEEIRLAALLAVTGTNAAWGQKTWNAIQYATDWINAHGGVKAWGGARIRFDLFDTESRPEVAGSQMERIVQGNYLAVTGCNQSAATVVATQVGERSRTPLVTATDVDPLITSRGFRFTFRTPPLIDAYAADMLRFVKEVGEATGVKVRKVAVLCENSIIGQSAAKASGELAREMGFEVVDVSTYDAARTNDFSGYISRYKAAGVEFLFGHNRPADAILITRTMKELDFNPIAYGGLIGGHESVEYINTLKEDAENVLVATAWSSALRIPGLEEWMKEYEARFKVAADAYFAAGLSVVSVFWDALERLERLDRVAFRDAIAATSLNTGDRLYVQLHGCKFKPNGDNERSGGVIVQIQNGRWATVGPRALASASVVWPKPRWKR